MFEEFQVKYCLTQASRPDRTEQFKAEAKAFNIDFEFFYSLPGKSCPEDVGRERFDSFCKSQLGMLQQFQNTGKRNLLCFEDDCIFVNTIYFARAFKELPDDWDILYLGANVTDPHPEKYSKHLRKIRSAWTTHGIAYSRKMVDHIVSNYKSWEESGMYDDWLSNNILPVFNCFVTVPMIAYQRPVYSDLWQKEVNYGWIEIDKKLL